MEEKYELKEASLKLLATLDQTLHWNGNPMCLYKGFWCPINTLHPILSMHKNFKVEDTDIILSTMPKSGTIWLKAITFSIVNRHRFSITNTPLLTTNPHMLVPFLEIQTFKHQEDPNLDDLPRPRIFSTHMALQGLPDSVFRESKCRVIYICRNPLDTFVSEHQFMLSNLLQDSFQPPSKEEALELFCRGVHRSGPFWDHVLGYRHASLENPRKVLFLKYEDMKEDILSTVKKIAEFLDFPFSEDEEKSGVVEEIANLCSFENLKCLEEKMVANEQRRRKGHQKGYFRKGQVGDWVNYLTAEMAERINKVVEDKLAGVFSVETI